MTTTKAIIFDYGNVLDIPDDWEVWNAHRDQLAARYGIGGLELWRHIYQGEAWQQVKRGKLDLQAFRAQALARFGIIEQTAHTDFFNQFYHGRDRIHPDMLALIRELRSHYKLAILSNTDLIDMERWLIEDRGADGLFDLVVSSAQVGMAKPDREIYEYTIRKLELPAAETLFIDDLERNTLVAEEVGIPCIIFTSPAQCRSELIARSIEGVTPAVETTLNGRADHV